LHPGHYLISARKPGFKTVTVTQLELNVQDNVVRNFALQVGSIAETITITADDLHINTTDGTVSTVVDRQFAENLPLNGRSFQTLIQLTPGVVLTAANGNDTGQFSINGQRGSSNYWMVDGVSANVGINGFSTPGNGLGGALGSFSVFGGTNSLVSVDALQEFRIQTSTFAPEFGRTPGGQISIVTRSGTNQFHGTVFDYLRNDIFDANNWFNTAVTPALPKAQERQNDFGGTFSGPILKDRTFFFFSYEGLRLRLPQTALTTVPCDSTCQVFGNARASAVSAMQPYLNAFPLPNGPEVFTTCTPNVNGCPASGQQSTGAAQFNSSFSNPGTLDAYSLRIDHRLSDKLALFGRYNYSPSKVDQRGFSPDTLSSVTAAKITTETATAGVTWSISPVITNDFRFNYSHVTSSSDNTLDNFGGAVPLGSLPVPSPFTSQDAQFNFVVLSLGSNFAIVVGKNAQSEQRQINLVDSLSVQKGSHGMKFGVDFRRLSPQIGGQRYAQTPIFFGVPDAQKGNAFLSFVISERSATLLFRNLGAFAQDTWRVFPRLTLTYGLRWDVDFAPTSISGPALAAVTGFNLRNLSSLTLAPSGTQPYSTTYGNLAPRVGVAYQLPQSPDWQTVLRGGFGLFYDLATSEVGNNVVPNNYPFGRRALVFGSFPLSASAAAPPQIVPPNASNGQTLFGYNPNLELPYTLEWNAALEQALGKQQTLTVSYVGAVGRRLLQTGVVSNPNPNYGSAELVTNAAASNYNALQLQFQRRLLQGLQALASYTWSHSIDTASAGSVGALGSGSNSLVASLDPNINRGPSDFDIRHAFSMGLTYDVPVPKSNTFINAILRRWSTESTFQARSAPPVNVRYNPFSFGGSISGFQTFVRPDVVPGQSFYLFGSQYPGGKAFNPSAFAAPAAFPFGQGNLARNSLRGFGAYEWDLAVHRDFPLRERLKLQFRAELFNILNHPNFGPPNGDLGSPTVPNPQFGLSTQMLGQSLGGTQGVGTGAFNPLYQIGGPRSMQFALKLMF